MDDAITDIRKRRGRPAIGSTAIMLKLPPDHLAKLDDWIALQPDRPSRPEAVRRLLAEALGQ